MNLGDIAITAACLIAIGFFVSAKAMRRTPHEHWLSWVEWLKNLGQSK